VESLRSAESLPVVGVAVERSLRIHCESLLIGFTIAA
jgi:hypothetical protein